MYCAANACIEQVIQHGEVDVFQAVKTVRRHRPQVVENIVSFICHVCKGNNFFTLLDGIQILLRPGFTLRSTLPS